MFLSAGLGGVPEVPVEAPATGGKKIDWAFLLLDLVLNLASLLLSLLGFSEATTLRADTMANVVAKNFMVLNHFAYFTLISTF